MNKNKTGAKTGSKNAKGAKLTVDNPFAFQLEDNVPPPQKGSKAIIELFKKKLDATVAQMGINQSFPIEGNKLSTAKKHLEEKYPDQTFQVAYTDKNRTQARVWRLA